MSDPVVLANSSKIAAAAREHGTLAKLAGKYRRFKKLIEDIGQLQEMLTSPDADERELAATEIAELGSSSCRRRSIYGPRSGTGHGSYLTFASRKGVTLRGQATEWAVAGDSGNVKSHAFCPACGAPVYLTFKAWPELFTIHAASLDDPARYKPQMVTYGVRGHAWDHVDAALPKFDRMPPP